MSEKAQSKPRPFADQDYEGGEAPPEPTPPDPDKEYPPPWEDSPASGDLEFEGGEAPKEPVHPDPDKEYPPPEVADNNGR